MVIVVKVEQAEQLEPRAGINQRKAEFHGSAFLARTDARGRLLGNTSHFAPFRKLLCVTPSASRGGICTDIQLAQGDGPHGGERRDMPYGIK